MPETYNPSAGGGSPERRKQASPEKKENKSPQEQNSAESVRNEQRMQSYTQAERKAATRPIENDIEYKTQRIDASLGYVPYLEALLREVTDKDEWFGDSADEQAKEKVLLKSAVDAVRGNLETFRGELENSTDKSSRAYERLRALYTERSARLTELLANVDENYENTELRDTEAAVKQAQETIKHMTTEQAIDWVARMMAQIDANNWQSKGLKETFGKLAIACRQAMQMKLAQEKTEAMKDPKKAKDY